MKLLHPFMPFLSEELWQHIAKRTPEEALVIAQQQITRQPLSPLID